MWLLITIPLGPIALLILLIKGRVRASIAEKSPVLDINKIKDSQGEEEQPEKLPHNPKESSNPNNLNGVQRSTEGYVYVVSNPLFPQLIKIGFTSKPPEERIDELDSTGLPEKFIEHYRVRAIDAQALEKRLHAHFDGYRYRKNREFFKLTPQQVYSVLLDWGVEPLEF